MFAVGIAARDTGAVPYDPTIYLGSAAHYRNGRPAYSPELEAVLTEETGLDGNGRLLGLAAGQAAPPSAAHLFEQGSCDLDARMLRGSGVAKAYIFPYI